MRFYYLFILNSLRFSVWFVLFAAFASWVREHGEWLAPSTPERRGMGGTEEGLNQMACVRVCDVYNTHMWRPRTPWYMCGDQRTALGVGPLLLPCLGIFVVHHCLCQASQRELPGILLPQPPASPQEHWHYRHAPLHAAFCELGRFACRASPWANKHCTHEPSPQVLKWHFLNRKHKRIPFHIYASGKNLKLW